MKSAAFLRKGAVNSQLKVAPVREIDGADIEILRESGIHCKQNSGDAV